MQTLTGRAREIKRNVMAKKPVHGKRTSHIPPYLRRSISMVNTIPIFGRRKRNKDEGKSLFN
jgi:hypothetical protein